LKFKKLKILAILMMAIMLVIPGKAQAIPTIVNRKTKPNFEVINFLAMLKKI